MGWFDDPAVNFRDQFNAQVSAFDSRVAALAQAETELWDVQDAIWASNDQAALMEWDNAMQRVIAMSATVESVRAQIQSVSAWWASVKDSLGITGESGGALSGLGLIPAVPWSVIALIVGGTAAIGGVLYAAAAVIEKGRRFRYQQAVNEATASGQPIPEDMYPVVETPGLFDNLAGIGNSLVWIVGGMVLLAVLPKLREGK